MQALSKGRLLPFLNSFLKTIGVVGLGFNGHGVWGQAQGPGAGVLGTSKSGAGVVGISEADDGVGVIGRGKRLAGLFEGDVKITNDLEITRFLTVNGVKFFYFGKRASTK